VSWIRTSWKHHRKRPGSNNPVARWAWDWFASTGEIESMRLIDGDWFCLRPSGKLDAIECCQVWEAIDLGKPPRRTP
jgi:hypothetical protein